ncbi:DUF1847 domain-containing protein [Desulfovibrio sp. 86]|uniref:Metal-binding protein n=1 Tax=uncultured Desulfovibrio sp. TaxID=167968 RepID=A0A212L8F7_9BACT|nr:DUF1847 domain-containing protein [Desulfovibrio sp. 86]SCM73800.1 conserved hypothetical protein [uncultured Desulfovibrio sp.]VZH34429.1 conserved protein of unknown function [Desulfovibrio sp. 86]
MNNSKLFSCATCGVMACSHDARDKYPDECVSKNIDQSLVDQALDLYKSDPAIESLARDVARIEKEFYCKYTRVEETIELILRQKYSLVGVATCIGLLRECSIFCRILEKRGINYLAVGCKVGAIDKEFLGLGKDEKLHPEFEHESMCNPALQALYLNTKGTQFNVVMGLCPGHDAIFLHYIEAPTTVMIVKDRVLAHNPAAALYTLNSYYERIKA